MEKLKRHMFKHRVPYLLMILFAVMMIVHLNYNYIGMYGDDSTFYVFFPDNHDGLLEFLKYRYNNWTSRLSVEIVMFCFIKHRFAFAVLDSLIFVVFAYALYLLFNKKSIVLSIVAVCMFPFYVYKSCGLYAASVNYTWPVALLAYGLVYVKKLLRNERLNILEIILMVFCFIFVSFVEICTVLMLIYLITAIIYHYIKNKKVSPLLIVAVLIALFGVIFFLLSPGNANRSLQEIRYFPEYKEYNIIQKLTYGLVFVGNANGLIPCAVNICFYALLIFIAFKCKKDILTKICSLAPVVLFGLFYLVYIIVGLANNNLNFDFLFYANDLVFDKVFIYLLCAYAVLISIFPLICISRIFKGEQRVFLILNYILAIGMLGSFGLNGSISFFANYRPTIFSSLVFALICLEMVYGLNEMKTQTYNGNLIIMT